jgi:hypothetical protein
MNEMGYKDQPFLIYFHGNTANNHIHIISARVDRSGNRIASEFEGKRAVDAINRIMGKDISYSAKLDAEKLFAFQFSTPAQAKLLLKQMGWRTSEKNDQINLIKNGKVQHSIDLKQIKNHISSYSFDVDRKKQLTAILSKYSKGSTLEEIKGSMKTKFGIDLVFHTGKGHTIPYGYTLIDNQHKVVYKGNDIVPIKNLIEQSGNRDAKIRACNALVNLYVQDEKKSFDDFKKDMLEVWYRVSTDGKIRLKSEYGYLAKLTDAVLKKLKYNERVKEAAAFKCSSSEDKKIIAQLLFVKSSDFDVQILGEERDKYITFLESVVNNKLDLEKTCKSNGFSVFKDEQRTFLVDSKNKILFDATQFDLSRDIRITMEHIRDPRVKNRMEIQPAMQPAGGIMASVFAIVSHLGGSGEQGAG